jgi:dTDP-4-dehydrorhamnose 3,5-epimerase
MKIAKTPIEGLLILEPRVFTDERGFFLEAFRQNQFQEAGIPFSFVQDNHTRSRRGVLRGLHYQRKYPQGRLVYVTSGALYAVAVDIREDSPDFGRWFGIVLSDENHLQLWTPPKFALGICVVSEQVDFTSKCSEYYHPEDQGGLIWNDPDLNIKWPIEDPQLSLKDKNNPRMSDSVQRWQERRMFSEDSK